MAYDPALLELMRKVLLTREGISERAMFGGYCWLLHGNMLCGVDKDRFMFRVGKAQETEALARPGCEIVSFNGRRMGGIVWVQADLCLQTGLDDWLNFAACFVGNLAPK